MKRDGQRGITGAVEFLRVHGADPDQWTKPTGGTVPRKVARRQREIDRLAAETIRDWGGVELPRASRQEPVIGPPRP